MGERIGQIQRRTQFKIGDNIYGIICKFGKSIFTRSIGNARMAVYQAYTGHGLNNDNEEDGEENMTIQANGLNKNKNVSEVSDSEEESEKGKERIKKDEEVTMKNDAHLINEEQYTPTIAFNKKTEAIFEADPKWLKNFNQGLCYNRLSLSKSLTKSSNSYNV